jgi:hypothetical protein
VTGTVATSPSLPPNAAQETGNLQTLAQAVVTQQLDLLKQILNEIRLTNMLLVEGMNISDDINNLRASMTIGSDFLLN